jgi:hypothetical protein
VALSLALFAAAASAVKRPTLVVTQGHEELGGIKVYINQHGLKIVYMVGKCYIISRAPDWRVLFYNPANNKGIEMPVAEWLHHKMRLYYIPIPESKNDFILVPQTTTKMFGFPCKHYLMVRPAEQGRPISRDPKQRKYAMIETPLANQIALKILQHAFEAPPSAGVPVSMTYISYNPESKDADVTGHRIVRTLVTTEVATEEVSDDFFQYPTNFKPAKIEAEIMNDPKRDKDVYGVFYP